jgi:hypothetical protein
LTDKLIDAQCANDDEFLLKAAYLLKADVLRWALVDAVQKHLERRSNPGGG